MIFAMLDFYEHVKAELLSHKTLRALGRHYQQNVFVFAAARSPLSIMELVTQLNAHASVPVSQLDVNKALQGIAHQYEQLPDGKFQATDA